MPTPASSRPADKKTDEEAATPDSPQPSKPGRGLHLLASPLRVLRHPGSALAGLLPRHGGAPRTPASRSAALLLLAAVSTLLFVLHRFGAGFAAHFEPAALRATFEAAGPVGGVVLYVAAFCVGELLHLPGTLFVAAGVLVWGCVPCAPRAWRKKQRSPSIQRKMRRPSRARARPHASALRLSA